MHPPVSNFISQNVEAAMRGTANLDSSLTSEEELVGRVEMMGSFSEAESIILALGKGMERLEQVCFLDLKKANVLN